MKVYAYPADSFGVGSYRVTWPAEECTRQGLIDLELIPAGRKTGLSYLSLGSTDHAEVPADADVMVFQRVTRGDLVEAFRAIQRRGVAVVVDVDDDLTCMDPANPVWAWAHPRRDPRDNWSWLSRACAEATLVTCSTPALLKRFAPHGRGVVLENCVPARFLDVGRDDRGGTDPLVGWAGTMQSHPRDLQIVGSGVRDAGVRFTVVGDPAGVGAALGLGEDPPGVKGGGVPFRRWPQKVAELDVGIAPLASTKFNQAKSWLKPLEYAACGVPCVASPSDEYRRFSHMHGNEVTTLAVRPRDWARALRNLRSPDMRAEVSAAGRQAVHDYHTYERNAWRWAEAWEVAAKALKAI